MVSRQDAWRIVLLGVVFGLLILIPLFFENARYTGFLTYNPYAGGTQPIQNQEPDAAAPSNQAYNSMDYDQVLGKYYFKYTGPDMTIVYTITPDGTSTTKTALMRSVSANVAYGGSSFTFDPARGGVRLNLNGNVIDPWSSSTAITRTITSQSFDQNGLKVVYSFSVSGASTQVAVNYKIKGKTLIVDMSSPDGFIDRIGPETTSGGNPAEIINPRMSYAHTWSYSVRKGNVFVNAYNDGYLSKASSISSYFPSAISGGRTFWNYYVNYDKNTDGTRQPLSERFYITVSQNWPEIFPNIPNPISPYRSYMANHILFDVWDVYYYCTDISSYFARMHAYGMRDVMVNMLGFCNQWNTKLMPNLTYYNFDGAKYGDYIDCYPGQSCYNTAWLAKEEDGTPVKAFFSPQTNTQSYALLPTRQTELSLGNETFKKNGGLKFAFIDILANGPPWSYIDHSTTSDGANAVFQNQRTQYIAFLQQVKSIFNGPVLSEGGAAMHWAGYVDSWEGSQTCCTNDYQTPVIVDFLTQKVNPLALSYPAYWRRFMPNGNNDPTYKGISTSDIDKYVATEIAFGQIAFIDGPLPNLHNIPDGTVIRIYYMMKELQKEYGLHKTINAAYLVSGQWVSVSDAARANYDFVNSQIKVTYDNGLVVYANRHNSASFNVDYNGMTYTIPPSSYIAYNPGDNFFEFSGLLNGKRVDDSENSQYVFLDPRGATVNFTLQDNNYYTAERFNIGKAKETKNFTFTIFGKTTLVTSEPLLLHRLSRTGQNVRVTMNSNTGIPISVVNLGGSTPPPAPTCNTASFCQNGNVYRNNTDCSQTLVQTCQFGCSNAVCNSAPPTDTTPPTISLGAPSGILPTGTVTENLIATTDEAASCKYSIASGMPYNSMANSFDITGTTSHSTQISGISDGQTYNFYVKCQDTAGNANPSDYVISFSVSAPPVLPEGNSSITYPQSVSLLIDGQNYDNSMLNGTKNVRVVVGSKPVIEFPYSFNGMPEQLNLSSTNIETGVDNGVSGYTLVRSLPVTQKTLFVEKVADVAVLCVKDAVLNSINDISENCDQPQEQILVCPTSVAPSPQGLKAEFFVFSAPNLTQMPDFSGLSPDLVQNVSQINFAPVSGGFYGTPYLDRFAVRYSGYINIQAAGNYIFYLSSDDGSKLLVDGNTIVNNDFNHAMREVAGTAQLAAGIHSIAVQFYENAGSAGVILSWVPPGGSKQVVPASVLQQTSASGSTLSCTVSGNQFVISPLTHSGVKQYICSQAWACSDWSSCSSGIQTRACTCSCYGGTGCTGDNSEQQSCTQSSPVCGNNVCESGETCSTCSSDCGACPPPAPSSGGGGGGGGGSVEPPQQTQTTPNTTEQPKIVVAPAQNESPAKIIKEIRDKNGNFAPVVYTDSSQDSGIKTIRKSYTLSWIIIGLSILGVFAAYQFAQKRSIKAAAVGSELRRLRSDGKVGKSLKEYVKVCRDQGFTDKKIRSKLESVGWDDDQIRKGLR